ncbi:MAG TPA: hypothetical protein VMJ93_06425 [Verrucomicrobiae bacterium]|nr:hypothetical protein [Verrucomicrobiae bacterium]
MRFFTPTLSALLFASQVLGVVTSSAQNAGPLPPAPPAATSPGAPTPSTPAQNSTITVPAGTHVELALTSAVWTKSAKPGDPIYAVTDFPVLVNNQIAIPPGTYVQGQIDSLTKPGWLSPHAQFQMHFSKLIFANGYTVSLPEPPNVTAANDPAIAAYAAASDVAAAVATPYVQVSSSSEILLDNGAQFQMVVQIPVVLDAQNVAMALKDTKAPPAIPAKSAAFCRPIPGTPGTPDTVIPGTPGTPGTPPTVIPSGVPGAPDTVIPGTPGTPGTPDTVIPGSPGTPGRFCPAPPVVTRNEKVQVFTGPFEISSPVIVGGTRLAAGNYEAKWAGPAPSAQVEIVQKGKTVATASARILMLDGKAASTVPETRTNPDGTITLNSLRFAGQALAVYFDPGASASAP